MQKMVSQWYVRVRSIWTVDEKYPTTFDGHFIIPWWGRSRNSENTVDVVHSIWNRFEVSSHLYVVALKMLQKVIQAIP